MPSAVDTLKQYNWKKSFFRDRITSDKPVTNIDREEFVKQLCLELGVTVVMHFTDDKKMELEGRALLGALAEKGLSFTGSSKYVADKGKYS